MDDTPTLREYLEEYLKHEGLYGVMPEYRRQSLLTLPIATIWLVGLWLLAGCLLVSHRSWKGLPVAILGLPLLLMGSLVIIALYFVVRQLRSGRELTTEDAGLIGGFFLIGLPIVVAIALGLYLQSWSVTLLYAALSGVFIAVVLILQTRAYKVHLVIQSVRTTFKVLRQSITLLPTFIALLLVTVWLSLFSEGLWQALAGLSSIRFLGSALVMVVPVLLYVSLSLGREATEIVGESLDGDGIARTAEDTSFVKERLERGLISEEEWKELLDEFEWRDKAKIADAVLPPLQSRTKQWLALLFAVTSLGLVASFFIYFFGFFAVLLEPSLVADWVGTQVDLLTIPLGFWTISLPTTAIPTAKVSLMLALFVAVMSGVYALTDEVVKRLFTEWLHQKSASWLSLASLYQCITSPGYQVWEYVVRDADRSLANVSIVVPKGLSEEKVEEACEHMESRLHEWNIVSVTAFERSDDQRYRRGMPGRRWELVRNQSKGIRRFRPIHLVLDELRYEHFLGQKSLEKGRTISDEWFGETPVEQAVARAIWQTDLDQDLVLHPYAVETADVLSVEIQLVKRLAASEQYRGHMRTFLNVAREHARDATTIMLVMNFRDTVDSLASLTWSSDPPLVQYKDEVVGTSRIEDPDEWA